MELILLVLIAGLVGFGLARSRFSKSIDQTTEKVTDGSKEVANRAGGWFRDLFSRKKPADETVDADFEGTAVTSETEESKKGEPEPAEVKPAAKSTSRRKSTKEEEEVPEE